MKPTRPNTDIPAWLQTTTTTPTPAMRNFGNVISVTYANYSVD